MKRQRRPFTVYQRAYTGRDGSERRTRTWYVRFSIAGRRHRRSLKARDRRAAELLAADMVRREELRRAGAVDPFEEQRVRPLAEHLADFETTLRARGVVEQYVRDRMACLRGYVRATAAKDLAALDAVPAIVWLAEAKASGLSARSVNRRLQALRQFGRFLLRTRRAAFDPFETLSPLNQDEDRRHVRRALTAEEAERLINAARSRPLEAARAARASAGVSKAEEGRLRALGEARALLYAVALGTGLRRGALRRLRWGDVDPGRGLVTVRAESAKARREQTVPLRADLAAAVVAHRGGAMPTNAVFPSRTFPNLRTFKRDLVAAGIARVDGGRFVTEDENGRAVDFHSLRYSFVSALAASGVHPRVAQALARHSRIDLTMGVYTDLALLDRRGAVEALPSVPVAVPQRTPQCASTCLSLPAEGEAEVGGEKRRETRANRP